MMPTIRQIAKAARVSPMTVSFVINNKPGQVSDDTRERVLKMVREMGYRPRAATPSRHDQTMHTLGVASGVSSESLIESGYYSSIMGGILNATQRLGANVMLFHKDLFHTDTHQSIRAYFDGRSEGLLVVAPNRGSQLVRGLFERGVPFVLIGVQSDNESVSCVDIDNRAAVALAIDHLIGLGHRRIGFIGGPEFVESAIARRSAYREILTERGLPYDPRLDVADPEWGNSYSVTLSLLRLPESVRPTALLCWNDGAASRSLMAIQDAHLNCPRDISLIGVDDDMASFHIHPPLTTIRQPYQEIGGRAVEALMARIREPFAEPIPNFSAPDPHGSGIHRPAARLPAPRLRGSQIVRRWETGFSWLGANTANFTPTSIYLWDGMTNDYFYVDQMAGIPNGARPDKTWPYGSVGAAATKHTGTCNFAFADGHVKAIRPVQTNPDPLNRPQDNMWKATRN